jgi:hypothetical protein
MGRELELPVRGSCAPTGLVFTEISSGTDTSAGRYGPECPSPESLLHREGELAGLHAGYRGPVAPAQAMRRRFRILGNNVISKSFGLLIYSKTGGRLHAVPGRLLVPARPVLRTTVQNSGGNGPPADCSGKYTFEFNDYMASGADPGLTAGKEVWTQYWYRDTTSPSGTGLTDALHFTICQ